MGFVNSNEAVEPPEAPSDMKNIQEGWIAKAALFSRQFYQMKNEQEKMI